MVNWCPDNSTDGTGTMRFKDACFADFGNTVSVDSEYAVNGYPLGTPIFRSPETTLLLLFGPAANVWSFGATVRSPSTPLPINIPDQSSPEAVSRS